MNKQDTPARFDDWLEDESSVAALVAQQWLEPVEGKDAVIFPPTYLEPEGKSIAGWCGYNLDTLEGRDICQIDSVGSQANRMEPIFKKAPYDKLVPQVVIRAGARSVNLLDAGHRGADALIRFSDLEPDISAAFNSLANGNATPLAKLAPTSLVFGAWDSRATRVKVPRIVRSVIRAFNVRVVHRSATYIPTVDYVREGLVDPPTGKKEQDRMSEVGLSHAPASWTHGGIQVLGELRRDAALNLSALRALTGTDKDDTLRLRHYILSLALLSFTAPQDTFLREGCQLVPDFDHPATWCAVHHDGIRESLALSHSDAQRYAEHAAAQFGVGPNRQGAFDTQRVKKELALSKEESRKARG